MMSEGDCLLPAVTLRPPRAPTPLSAQLSCGNAAA